MRKPKLAVVSPDPSTFTPAAPPKIEGDIYDAGRKSDASTAIRCYPSMVLFDPWNPDPAKIHIKDIAHALSQVCRYGGHVPVPYNVAHHSVLVSEYFSTDEMRLAALLHDAEEAYIGDMPSPFKKKFPDFVEVSHNLRDVIFTKFGLSLDLYDKIKAADDDVYQRERLSIWNGKIHPTKKIFPVASNLAKQMFLEEFELLYHS